MNTTKENGPKNRILKPLRFAPHARILSVTNEVNAPLAQSPTAITVEHRERILPDFRYYFARLARLYAVGHPIIGDRLMPKRRSQPRPVRTRPPVSKYRRKQFDTAVGRALVAAMRRRGGGR